MTRRKARRLRVAANLYHRHYNAWRREHRFADCRAFVQAELVTYESLRPDGTVDVSYSDHAELLYRMANIRRRRRLSLRELRELQPSKRSVERTERELGVAHDAFDLYDGRWGSA